MELGRHRVGQLGRRGRRDPEQRFVVCVDHGLNRVRIGRDEIVLEIDAGRRLEPPNNARVPASVRVSISVTMSPSASSLAMTGSRWLIASISPFFIAATPDAPPPMPMKDASLGLRPAFTIACCAVMKVEEPGAVTPIFNPLKSAADLILPTRSLRTPITIDGKRSNSDDGADVLALGLHAQRVLIGPCHHIDRAAYQRLQRARAAGEVIDRHVEAEFLEIAVPLRDRQRQVIEQVLAADAERQLCLLLGPAPWRAARRPGRRLMRRSRGGSWS